MAKFLCSYKVPLECLRTSPPPLLLPIYHQPQWKGAVLDLSSKRLSVLSRRFSKVSIRFKHSSRVADHHEDMSFNEDKSLTKTIDVSKNMTLLNKSASCAASGTSPAFEATIVVDVDAQAHADITFGVVAQGSIVPPKMSSFGLFADFDATLDGTLTVEALASVRQTHNSTDMTVLSLIRLPSALERFSFSKSVFLVSISPGGYPPVNPCRSPLTPHLFLPAS